MISGCSGYELRQGVEAGAIADFPRKVASVNGRGLGAWGYNGAGNLGASGAVMEGI